MAINKRIPLLALTILAAALTAALVAALTFGGGAKQTVASRSAAAFREAERKGEPVGEGAHGHGALSPGAKAQPSHGEHRASETRKTDDMLPSKPIGNSHAGHATSAEAGPRSAAGREGQRQEATGHAGMQHGDLAAAGPARESMSGAPAFPPLRANAAEASPGQPVGTLRPDPLDQPVETSVIEAARAAELAREMATGHGMQHGLTSYRQIDAGRDAATTGQEERSPKPAPGKPTPSVPPEPTHPPHHSGGNDESPRHGEAAR